MTFNLWRKFEERIWNFEVIKECQHLENEAGIIVDWPFVDTEKGNNDDRGGITSTLFLFKRGLTSTLSDTFSGTIYPRSKYFFGSDPVL